MNWADRLAESWLINNRMNLYMLDLLTPDALEATLSTRGGRTIGQQLAHVLEVRRQKVSDADKELGKDLPVVERADGHDVDLLREGFTKTGEAIAELIRRSADHDGKTKGFKRGIFALVGYFIAHDAHHRGHAMLTLKVAKVKRDPDLRFGLWGWNQR